jgi:conjugal transfer pilin signal peptidase TrbI
MIGARFPRLRVRPIPAAHWRVTGVAIGFGLLLAAAIQTASARFEILVDGQTSRCLEDTRALVLDRRRHDLARGAIYAFTPPEAAAALFRPGIRFAKRIAGLPGDVVQVSAEVTTVNGVVVGHGLDLAATLGVEPARLERRFTVPEGRFFPMGETRDSLDGRYYGAVAIEAGIGRAWRLF